MEQIDRRVRRTQKSLGVALISLALEKEYDAITIQEITDRADIGYRTFFRHYADKDELLKDVLSTTMAEVRELMAPPPLELFTNPNLQAADLPDGAILFRHVQENSDLYRVLLFSDRTLIQPLKAFAIQEFKATYRSLPETDIPFDIIINHMVSAMITLLRWWLENDMAYSPEVMGEYAFRLIIQPARELLLEGLPE
jgi:AcrR family transcriptional regulator